MKKNNLTYIICFIILLSLQVTHGFQCGVTYYVSEYPIPYHPGTMAYTALFGNLVVTAFCYIAAFISTVNRNNKSKFKWLILLAIVAYSMYVPVLKADSWYESWYELRVYGVHSIVYRPLIMTF